MVSEHEYNQLNIIHNGDEVDIMEYGRLTTVTNVRSNWWFRNLSWLY